jgi:hypothetical protein
LFDCADKWRLKVGIGRDGIQNSFPEQSRVVNSKCRTDPLFPRLTLRDVGPSIDANNSRFDGCPNIDIRVARDKHVRVIDSGGDSRLFGFVDEMIEQYAKSSATPRAKRTNYFMEVVGSVEKLDDDSFNSEIIAPYFFDEFGVVDSLDQQSTGTSHTCWG